MIDPIVEAIWDRPLLFPFIAIGIIFTVEFACTLPRRLRERREKYERRALALKVSRGTFRRPPAQVAFAPESHLEAWERLTEAGGP